MRFIRRFLTKYNRWTSPKFLFGESYGTTRDAVLSNDLANAGIDPQWCGAAVADTQLR